MPLLLVVTCCAICGLGAFLFGYDTGIVSSVIVQKDFQSHLSRSGTLSDSVIGGIVSSFTVGAILGTISSSFVSDKHGRRAAIFLGAAFAALGGALQGGSNGLATILIGRISAGVGIGIMSPTIPNYCVEVAPQRLRGFLGGFQQWMLGLGIVASQWVGYGCALILGPFGWRFPLAIQVVPALILMGSIYFLPESPRNLAERGQTEAAYHILRMLRRKSGPEVMTELNEILEMVERERREVSSMSWKALFLDVPMRKALLVACGIQLFTQTSGVNVIGYYGPKIYKSLGISLQQALLIQGIYGALALFWNTICLLVVDRVGRRVLLIPSVLGMGAAMCVQASLVEKYDPQTSTNADALRATVAMNFVFSIFFTSLGTLSWIYASEVFPNGLRGRGTSISTLVNWSSNLIVAQTSPLALTRLGSRYSYVFAAFNWIAALLIWRFFPETQSKHSLESVVDLFGTSDIQRRKAEKQNPRPEQVKACDG